MKSIASFPARLWAKLRALGPVKKLLLILAALCLAAVLVLALGRRFVPVGGPMPAAPGELVRTTRLERQTLSESITVTGTVESAGVTNVTTNLSYPVAEILVQVGDTVRAGDVICRLDSSDLEKELEQKQKQLSENKETAQKNYDRAQENYDSAVSARGEAESAYYAAGGALETARNTQYLSAADSVLPYQQALDAAQAAENDAGIAVNHANVAFGNASAALAGARAARDAAQFALDADPENTELQTVLHDAQAALDAAQAEYDAASGAYAAAQAEHAARAAGRQAAETALREAKQNSGYDALFQAYTQADEAFLRAKDTYERAVESEKQAKETLENAADNLKKASESDDLSDLYERIEDCTITAGADGTITALNVTVGSSAGGVSAGALAVIQDTAHLKVAISIDEDDIKRVAVGQRAVIRSDATGDAQIGGRLSQLSLTAGSSGGGVSGGSGFGAEVTVTDGGSGLLVGLSAKVELILSQAENVYAVPYEALETDEAGNTVIYARLPGEAEFTAFPVETGLETDYYIEIRGDGLSDGMEVRVGTDNLLAQDGDGLVMMDGGQMFMTDGGMVTVEGGDAVTVTGPAGNMPGGMPGGMGGGYGMRGGA